LVDAPCPTATVQPQHADDQDDEVSLLMGYLCTQMATEGDALHRLFAELSGAPNLDALVKQAQRQGYMPADLSLADVRGLLGTSRQMMRAVQGYRPQALPMPVHYFAAERLADTHDAAPSQAWFKLLGEHMQCSLVSGDHWSVIRGADVAHLAQAMNAALQQASQQTTQAPQSDYSPLVTIQAGKAGVTPVICVPGAGANITCYVPLTLALGNEVPVYGLQARGLDGALVPHTSVEAAAQTYVQALLDQQLLNGPCKLVGHSFGGWIAFEMARLLEAQGHQVDLLVLLDSPQPSAQGPRRRAYDRIDAMMELIKLIEMQSSQALGLTHPMLQAASDDEQIDLLHKAMVKAGVINARTPQGNVGGLFNVFTRNINTAYSPANGVNTPTILARAANQPTVNMARPVDTTTEPHTQEPDWPALSPVQARLTLAGNHMTLLTRPFIDEIAGLIKGGQDQNQSIKKSRSGS